VAVATACVHWLFKTQPEEAYLMCSLIPRDTTGQGVAVATACVHFLACSVGLSKLRRGPISKQSQMLECTAVCSPTVPTVNVLSCLYIQSLKPLNPNPTARKSYPCIWPTITTLEKNSPHDMRFFHEVAIVTRVSKLKLCANSSIRPEGP
jgi:hypothetical protein